MSSEATNPNSEIRDPKCEGPAELADLVDVEVAQFPCVDAKGRAWPAETADRLVETFAELAGDRAGLKPPMVLGHNEADTGKLTTGMPALGWIETLKAVAVDAAGKAKKLVSTVREVPRVVADLVGKGAYKRLSLSWWPDGGAHFEAAKGRPVVKHLGLLGADIPRVKTLADVAALYAPGEAPTVPAALAGEEGEDVAEFAGEPPAAAAAAAGDAAAAEDKPSPDLQAAVQKAEAQERLQPLFRAINERLWVIQDREGKSEAEILAGLKDFAQQILAELAKLEPAAAAGDGGAAAATSPGMAMPGHEMSIGSRTAVEATIVRMTGQGRLAPKHAPALRAQAQAVYLAGGDEAVAAYLDDEDGRRREKVVPIGEAARAELAGDDPAAEAKREYADHGIGRRFGVTEDQYVRARMAR